MIEDIVVKAVDPNAVLEEPTPVIASVIVTPFWFVPVIVNVLPVSSTEQYTLTTAFKSLASFNVPLREMEVDPGVLEVYRLSSSLTYIL